MVKYLALGKFFWIISLGCNTSVFFGEKGRGRFDTLRGERGNVASKAEIGLVWPKVKECRQLPEAGRGKE